MSHARFGIGRSIPRGLVGMLVLVALFEGFIHRHNLRFTRIEPDDWRSTAELADQALPVGGVLILGDSQNKFGISPLQVEGELGQPTQCLAIQGGQAPASYFLLKKALDSGMHPSAIIVDFEPHLLRTEPTGKTRMWAELATVRECWELCQATGDLAEFGAMVVGRFLPSYRERLEIRANLVAAFRGESSKDQPQVEMGRRNRGMNRGAIVMAKDLGNHQFDVEHWGNVSPGGWRPSKVNDLYARRLLRLAQAQKIPVYGSLMPVAPGVQGKYEQSGLDFGYIAWIQKLQKRFPDFRVLDWRHSNYEAFAFLDALHLNSVGASAVSAALGNHLKRIGHGELADERWTTMPRYQPNLSTAAVEDTSQSVAAVQANANLRR